MAVLSAAWITQETKMDLPVLPVLLFFNKMNQWINNWNLVQFPKQPALWGLLVTCSFVCFVSKGISDPLKPCKWRLCSFKWRLCSCSLKATFLCAHLAPLWQREGKIHRHQENIHFFAQQREILQFCIEASSFNFVLFCPFSAFIENIRQVW